MLHIDIQCTTVLKLHAGQVHTTSSRIVVYNRPPPLLSFTLPLQPVTRRLSVLTPLQKEQTKHQSFFLSSVQGLRHTHSVVFVIYFKQVQKSENKHFTMPVKKDKPTHFKPSELMLVSVITCSPPPSGAAFRQQAEAKPNRRRPSPTPGYFSLKPTYVF
ncbi:hypothetical protein ILYODFUR_003362 [Ilyodon furcidens]|uniref:Uncharacterized protein n=1 Tax=Ilyodon furcidens TaxID=33524 RepID=A0ABV0VAP4_9TELE